MKFKIRSREKSIDKRRRSVKPKIGSFVNSNIIDKLLARLGTKMERRHSYQYQK